MDVDLTVPVVHLHIGDEVRANGSGGAYQHVYPATGEVQGPVPLAGPDDVDAAVRAAHAAYPQWRAWRPAERARVLRRLAELMERDTAELARLSVLDNGMTAGISGSLVGIMASWTSYYAGWADKVEGRVTSFPANQRELAYSMPEPYGVVGIILTWNGPLVSVGMKLIPALAAGNTVVMKPSELTPYATEHLMALIREAGIPEGVVNLVLGGPATGDALVRHPLVEKVSFTGGPATARKILAACAESLKPAVLELGGKSANVLFGDADLDTAVAVNAFSVLGTLAGQGCAIPSRMVVHADIYDEVVERIVAMVAGMRCGDPFDPATVISPVVTREAQQRILAMIERAQNDGAKLLAGGRAPDHLPNGFFVEPTVFGEVDPGSELGQIEVFGPVLSLMRFETEEQAIAMANSTAYGLASYVYTQDINRVTRMVSALKAGGVYVNGASPVVGCELAFGGVGISGFGREGGEEGLFEFLRTKAVGVSGD
ncbi:aldehyde dehydrogenase [Mycobacterium alsense]|uniref:Putative succinate-semialdehyde dehydrogenase [NADP(+)] 2 n=1 Tax=Mycobacterium alsense TaxID=324058 RepID=A0AA41XK55_9MYCO|nr:aldehyde dehydrogenase family protein [Mycobacterium alsense]MCV7377555.1 aldehyde dehydrogenase [Mycobacterium alsense]OQZ92927.1 aldehyde dehydrogenase [Mycobacterium alsense]